MKKVKENKGITLIALIITIIVLIILAVVAINAVQGDGIIAHAKNARDDYQIAQKEENSILSDYKDKIEKEVNSNGGKVEDIFAGKKFSVMEFGNDIIEFDNEGNVTLHGEETISMKYTLANDENCIKAEFNTDEAEFEIAIYKEIDGKYIGEFYQDYGEGSIDHNIISSGDYKGLIGLGGNTYINENINCKLTFSDDASTGIGSYILYRGEDIVETGNYICILNNNDIINFESYNYSDKGIYYKDKTIYYGGDGITFNVYSN